MGRCLHTRMDTGTVQQKKWSCEYCTYENWPASKKCTLCHAPRPPQFITDNVNEEKDIYKMAALVQANNSICCGGESSSALDATSSNAKVLSSGSGGSGNANKWACIMCTFLNWPRSSRCTQCLSPRQKTVSVHSSTSAHTANSTDVAVSCGNSTQNPPSSPEIERSINNDINKTVATSSKNASSVPPVSRVNKWSCKVCTFENWPRASKCTLCGTVRGRVLSDSNIHSSVASSTSPTIVTSVPVHHLNTYSNATELHSSTKHPGRAVPAYHSPDKSDGNNQDIAGATSAGTSLVEDNKLSVRRRLRDNDWLWLNACQGVVDGDPNAVQAFIAAGGNPSRQLTADEVVLLSRPSAFEVGHTLVHLALRFGHEDMLAVLLTATDVAAKSVKRLPCHASPDLALDIRRHIASSLRQRKGDFPCFFFSDCVTFALPAGKNIYFPITL